MTAPPTPQVGLPPAPAAVAALAELLTGARRVIVLTGAGCSTASGLPAYRNVQGDWQHPQPMRFADFRQNPAARRRYWARSFAGWPAFERARPNGAHGALVALENSGRVGEVITQNVDGLHQRAGSRQVLDLHGRLDRVRCMDCGLRLPRADWQNQLAAANPGWSRGPAGAAPAGAAPDGDTAIGEDGLAAFRVPGCGRCGGVHKPDVVFFGEPIPPASKTRAQAAVAGADALLVVGSSLMVYSGFALVRSAAAAGRPVAAITLGRTRADPILALKVEADCALTLKALVDSLDGHGCA